MKHILDEIYTYVGQFIVYPSEHARVAHTLWIAHTHMIEAFQCTPRLLVLSAEKQSGKTRFLEITELLSQNAQQFINPSPASLYTLVETDNCTPTILIDEIDRQYEKRDTADITALLNADSCGERRYPASSSTTKEKERSDALTRSAPSSSLASTRSRFQIRS